MPTRDKGTPFGGFRQEDGSIFFEDLPINPELSENAQAGISGAAGIAGQFADAFSVDTNPEDPFASQGGFGATRDLRSIREAESGDLSGAAAGIGSAVKGASSLAPLGALGVIGGGILGGAAAIIKGAREAKARQQFEQRRQSEARDAMFVNSNISMRDRIMRNLGQSSQSQIDRLVRGLSRNR